MMGVSTLALTFFTSICLFYCIAVLFGAHPINQFWGSLTWALVMTFLTCVPALTVTRRQLTRVFFQGRFSQADERAVFFSCFAALVGAWVGAFPILLDWRRPWQVWPIPCCVGAVGMWTCFWLVYKTVSHFWPQLLAVSRTPL